MNQISPPAISSGQQSNNHAEVPTKGVSGRDILARAQLSREVIQDYVPLAESLEWLLGQEYLRQRGNKAFISDASPVPFDDMK